MFEKNATGLLSYLRVSVYFKSKHEEVTAKCSMGPFWFKNDLVHCQHCKAVYKYNSATTQMMYHLNKLETDSNLVQKLVSLLAS